MEAVRHETALSQWFCDLNEVAVAVSGGVDSMTLAVVAHRALGDRAKMYHAVSPAVTGEATDRVRRYATQEGWLLNVINAGEFDDPNYLANPVNRCFFCKQNLYATVAARTSVQTVSGANIDDLGDYRPGLQAAAQHHVRHPYVELGIDKAAVRALAKSLSLLDLAELPSAPCLSSRIETGIAIQGAVLAAVHSAEKLVAQRAAGKTVRCRVRAQAVVIELDQASLQSLSLDERGALADRIKANFSRAGIHHPVYFEPYRRGSAFLHKAPPANDRISSNGAQAPADTSRQ